MSGPQSGSSSREVTPLVLCKMGQATVQEIVNRTQDLFATLQSLQVPNGASVTVQSYKEKQDKLKDIIKSITTSFKSLRALYDRCNQIVISLEQNNPQDYIPLVGGPTNWSDLISSGYKERAQHLGEEKKELIEKLQAKNRQLRQVMERLRQLVWDINTMMAMKHTHPS
ncbi:mediator of RNA polymerase II transcription subunit 30-like [Apostichopus japonicus]|uniref:mediator of RNA polymerase II transcription subunit 30-like n=1 Tax=Stichopus japonicus TaxID=307972 RepID=UPI003AB40436